MFLKPESLVGSIRSHGIQIPLIARPHPRIPGDFQLVCGFRRANAARIVGFVTVPAVVRDLTDEEACILSYTENEFRKTLRDLDRAQAIECMKRSGKTTPEVAKLLRLGDRQVQRLVELLDYPPVLKEAIDREDSGLTTTHALLLMQAHRKYPEKIDLKDWIEYVYRQKMTVKELKDALAEDVSVRRPERPGVFHKVDVVGFDMRVLEGAGEMVRSQAIQVLEELRERLR